MCENSFLTLKITFFLPFLLGNHATLPDFASVFLVCFEAQVPEGRQRPCLRQQSQSGFAKTWSFALLFKRRGGGRGGGPGGDEGGTRISPRAILASKT